ncbi:MAG: hypothetical protein ACQGVC_17650 [Myxococcota bacterium]
MPATVDPEELTRRLRDPATAEQALAEYFVLVETAPFHYVYELRPGAPIRSGPRPADGFLYEPLMDLANRVARAARRRTYEERKAAEPDALRVVSEGDSWFQHPLLRDVIDHLNDRFNVLSLGAAGDALVDMVEEGEYAGALAEEKSKLLLFSGGGNDMLGDAFGTYLVRPAPPSGSPAAAFVNDVFAARVAELHALYDRVATRLEDALPDVVLLTHAYDVPVPRDRKQGGRWVGPKLAEAGIDPATDGRRVVRHMLEVFDAGLALRAASRTNLVHVSTLGSVADDEWDDELHPNAGGFGSLAARFRAKIDLILP